MRKAQVDFSIFFCASWIARGSYDDRHSAEMALQGSRLGPRGGGGGSNLGAILVRVCGPVF